MKQNLTEAIMLLKTTEFKGLTHEEFGIDFNLKEATKTVKNIYEDLIKVSENFELLNLSNNVEAKIFDFTGRITQLIKRMREFIVKGNPSAEQHHREIIDQANTLYQQDLELLHPLIDRVELKKLNQSDIKKNVLEAHKSLENIKKIDNEVQKTKENLNSIIKEVRDALGKEGALISVKDFSNQAEKHKKLARWWLVGFIISLLLTTFLIYVLASGKISFLDLTKVVKDDYPKIAQITIFKLILLSISYLLIYQTLKNYKVNSHLYILNQHRQLTLTVYPFMAQATKDQEQSNAIVAQAAKAIFDPGTTGYLDGEENPNPINLTEIITRVVDKK